MSLMDRIMLAVVQALVEDDPVVRIGVGDNQLVVSWPPLAQVITFNRDSSEAK